MSSRGMILTIVVALFGLATTQAAAQAVDALPAPDLHGNSAMVVETEAPDQGAYGPYEPRNLSELFSTADPLASAGEGIFAAGVLTPRGSAAPASPLVPALRQERRFHRGIALVAAGTALMITGAIMGDDAGTGVMVGGAGLIGFGVYRLMR